ncbi:uncharacterized protein [Temnothorax nylanderi]|uniref:uncharacterized protein n=1 Tax=Temnothorax nylanderi TaxID=102681 RepID=UPI003A85FC8C
MGRTCSYPGCKSGSAAYERYAAKHGLPQHRFFFIPKNPRRRQEWQKALKRSRPFTDTEVICDKHFADGDILFLDKLLLHDGSIFTSNKQKIRLSSTAIPHSYDQETNEKAVTLDNHAHLLDSTSSNLYDSSAEASTSYSYNQETHEKAVTTLDNYAQLDSTSSNLYDSSAEASTSYSYNQETHEKTAITLDAHAQLESTSSNLIDDANTESGTLTATDSNPCTVIHDTWNIVEEIANIILPDKWTYMICGNNVIIGIWKLNGYFVKRMVLESNSNSIKVYINNEQINVPEITAVNSTETLLENIKILEPLLLCNGRIATQEYSKQCLGFVDSNKTKVRYGHYWCVYCRVIKRKNCLNKIREKTLPIKYLEKHRRKQKIVRVERQRRRRMQSKIEKLKNKIGKLRVKCAVTQEKLLNEKIETLPPEQQENVNTLIKLRKMNLEIMLWSSCSNLFECITYLENAGFFCDVITTDGAQWNRAMWTNFGISEENISCVHPCDSERRLWFCSDFPHLIKNFRNWVVKHEEIWTPDGIVQKKCWKALLELEHTDSFALKISYKLSAAHINPKYYQKMNVALAFQFFSQRLAAAMTLLQSKHPDLANYESTVKFINRVDTLISIMTSRTSGEALKLISKNYEHIQQFIQFLNEWETETKKLDYIYLTHNTSLGLKITLRATLEIVEFLYYECNYEYLLTARLSQDALERFFGLARGVCGSNDHPDAILFGHMFRLMSTYSLIKPCKGSNVSGGEMLSALLTVDNISKETTGKKEFLSILDSIIENSEINNCSIAKTSDAQELQEKNSAQYITAYMAGYIVHKSQKWTSCEDCLNSLQSLHDADIEANQMIKLLSLRSLKYPSQYLRNLVTEIEEIILTTVRDECFQADTFFHVCYALQEVKLPLVGCDMHNKELTKRLINFYLIMRANFMSKAHNFNTAAKLKEKTKKARKDSKL